MHIVNTLEQWRQKYENLKKVLKAKVAEGKTVTKGTGGGPFSAHVLNLSLQEQAVASLMCPATLTEAWGIESL